MLAEVFAFGVPLILLAIGTVRGLKRGISISDEGYLVYGTLELMRGFVPIRDFRAYDPGRYIYTAAVFALLGKGYVSARLGMAFLSGIALIAIVGFVLAGSGNALLAGATGSACVLWMHPRHKQVESLFCVLCPVAATALAMGIGFWPGLIAGISLIFGLNLFVYFGAAFAFVLTSLLIQGDLGLWLIPKVVAGTVLGIAPLIALAATLQGTLRIYWQRKVMTILSRGSANLALGKPWLWAGEVAQFAQLSRARQLGFKGLFTVIVPISVVALVSESLGANSAPFVTGTAAASLAFFHHVHSRAGVNHFFQSTIPLVLLLALLIATYLPLQIGVAAVVGIAAFSLWVLWPIHHIRRDWLRDGRDTEPFTSVHDTLLLPPAMTTRLTKINTIVQAHGTAGDPLFAAPDFAGLFALVDRRSAAYDTYPIYPSTPDGQAAMLQDLKTSAPKVAVISKTTVDRRDDLRFAQNYTEVTEFIESNYTCVHNSRRDKVYVLQSALTDTDRKLARKVSRKSQA